MMKDDLADIILGYLNEETDGEFIRYYTLNPACLRPLLDDLEDYIMKNVV